MAIVVQHPRWMPSKSSLALAGVMLCALLSTRVVRLNVSPSVPYGVYRVTPLPPTLAVGMLVTLPVPMAMHPWLAWYRPLLKPVAALPGTEVCVTEGRLSVGGVDYGPVYTEWAGAPLPHLTDGCTTVPPDHVFLASHTRNSIDSRYFGAVPVAMLTAQAMPLWTWR